MNLIDILVSTVLALIMFGIGLSLTFKDFRHIIQKPKAVSVGLSLQMIVLPMIAFLFCYFVDIPPELKVGLIILSVCPGGTTSNFVTYMMDGNTALSIAMTTINSFITLFSIPFIVNIALVYFMQESSSFHLPYLDSILQIFSVTIIPASFGVFINVKLPKLSKKLNAKIAIPFSFLKNLKFNPIKTINIILLGVVFAIKIFASESAGGAGLQTEDFAILLPIGLAFNLIGLFFGYFMALIFRLKHSNPMTIGIEVGLQNTTLAFLVAGTLLQNTVMQKPALVYAFFSFWTAILFGLLTKKLDTKTPAQIV